MREPSYLGISDEDIERGKRAVRLHESSKRQRVHSSILLHPKELEECRRDAAHYQLPLSGYQALVWRNWRAQGKPALVCLPCEYDLEPEDE
jgi:hypothetical protein